MRGFRWVGSLMVLGALLGGCNKDDDSDEERASSTIESFATGFAEVACSALISCSCTDEAARIDCETAYREMMLLEVSMMMTQSPGMKLDPAAVQPCLDAFEASARQCTYLLVEDESDIPFCPGIDVLVGTRAEGQSCVSDHDCATGLLCHEGLYTCAAPAALGASCEWIECQEGLHCDVAGLCADRPGVDQECSEILPCEKGLTCLTGLPRVCAAPRAIEASCTDGAACVAGAYCDSTTATCLARLADGAACTSDVQCLHGWCSGRIDEDPANDLCANPGLCGYDGYD